MAVQPARPYPIARGPGCPPCPPCAVPFAGTPPAPGKPFFAPLDEAAPRGRGWGRVAKSLLPGFPPFLPEDLVPADEFSMFSGLGALTPEQKYMMQYGRGMNRWAKKEAQLARKAGMLQWKKDKWKAEHPAPYHGPVATIMSGLGEFFGLGAGPDPKTMTCTAIISGYEKNSLMASTRSKPQHRADAQVRVMELEPYYKQCKASAPGVTPDQPVEVPGGGTPLLPGELGPWPPQSSPAGFDMRTTGHPGPQPGAFDNIDWNKVGLAAGAGVGLLVLLAVLKKKKAKSA